MKIQIQNLLALSLLVAMVDLVLPGRAEAQAFTNIHNFSPVDIVSGYTNNDGDSPYGTLVLSGVKLYGTTVDGGPGGGGTVYALNTDGTGFTNLYSFGHNVSLNFTNGQSSQGGLILSGGRLYGTTVSGGISNNGTVFAINTDGSGFTNVHKFAAGGAAYPYQTNSDGSQPQDALVLGGGTLYGTTQIGGTNGYGTVFGVNTDSSGFRVLHHFTAASGTVGTYGVNNDGVFSRGTLVLVGSTLYGTALFGGTNGYGTVYAVNTDGSGFTALHTFTAPDPTYHTNQYGNNPIGGLVASGNVLYGRTVGGGGFGLANYFPSTPTGQVLRTCIALPTPLVTTSVRPGYFYRATRFMEWPPQGEHLAMAWFLRSIRMARVSRYCIPLPPIWPGRTATAPVPKAG